MKKFSEQGIRLRNTKSDTKPVVKVQSVVQVQEQKIKSALETSLELTPAK